MEDLLLRRRALMSANDGKLYIVRNGVLRPQYNNPYIAGQKWNSSASLGAKTPTVVSESGLYKITSAQSGAGCVVFRPAVDLTKYSKLCMDGEFYTIPSGQSYHSVELCIYDRVPTSGSDYAANRKVIGNQLPSGRTVDYAETSLGATASGFPAIWVCATAGYYGHAYISNMWLE